MAGLDELTEKLTTALNGVQELREWKDEVTVELQDVREWKNKQGEKMADLRVLMTEIKSDVRRMAEQKKEKKADLFWKYGQAITILLVLGTFIVDKVWK